MSAKAEIAGKSHIRAQKASDLLAIEALMQNVFGEGRHLRSVRHLRLCEPVKELSFVIEVDQILVGSIRYWPIMVGQKIQLLLGPLAINPDYKGQGFGKMLVSHSLETAARLAYDFVLISGEPDYYPRFGFVPANPSDFLWPGFIEAERLQIKWFDKPQMIVSPQAILPILP